MEKSLGQLLKELRTLNRYSQEFVASMLNVIRQTYSHYETGRIMPPADSLYKLSQLYNVPIERFFAFTDVRANYENYTVPNTKSNLDTIAEPPAPYSIHLKKITNTVDLNSLTPSDLEMLYYFQNLDIEDKIDILDFLKIKYKRHKEKK